MEFSDDKLYILQSLEFSVLTIARANPAMSDHVALRAYEAAFQFYRSEARGHVAKPPQMTGLDATTYDSVRAMCEFRLGRGPAP